MSFCLPARYLFVNARHKVRWTGGRWSSVRHVSGAPKEEAHSLSSSRQDNKLEVSLGEKGKQARRDTIRSTVNSHELKSFRDQTRH